jgi:hypothetical protein
VILETADREAMETTYKVKVTEAVTRTIVLEVKANSAAEADAKAIREARDTQPADWVYSWEAPATSSSEVISSN